jgi:uncharacterized phage protein (TIGR02218 family)
MPYSAHSPAFSTITVAETPPPPPPCPGGERPLSTLFAEAISGECLTLAVCLKLTRQDGTVYGFTTLDEDLIIDGVTYEAADGLGLSNLRTKTGTGVDNLQITGLQVTNRVVEADMHGGRYDGARIRLFAVDYEDLAAGPMVLLTGNIGVISFSDGGFEFEARSLTQRLSQQVGDLYSPLCRVRQLGDAQCKVDLAAFTFSRTVADVLSRGAMDFGSDTHPTDYFTYGLVTFTSGANAGISRPVRAHNSAGSLASIDVQEPFPFNIEVGDVANLVAGCPRTTAVCIGTFSNIVNFHGEPMIPRSDQMLTVSRTNSGVAVS